MTDSEPQSRNRQARLSDLRLTVVSHKPCWPIDPRDQAAGYETDGGFPEQMRAISTLFAHTRLLVTTYEVDPPGGLQRIGGNELEVVALKGPRGQGIWRKAHLPLWLLRNGARLLHEIWRADVVHAVVPGDIGVLGLQIARLLRKPLFVRHCGTWGNDSTAAYRFLARTLPRLAARRKKPTVILATGGPAHGDEMGDEVAGAPGVHWIFSSSLTQERLETIPRAECWQPGKPLSLVFVGRMTRAKNAYSLVEAMPRILEVYPDTRLTLLGHGPDASRIQDRISNLGLETRVQMAGNVSRTEVLSCLSLSSLMVFPTQVAEGFPKAVLESLACGVPVLAPPVSVLPALLHERAGKILRGVDPESIASDVIECIEDPAFFTESSNHAIDVASNYSLERWAAEIGRHLCNALALDSDLGRAGTANPVTELKRVIT